MNPIFKKVTSTGTVLACAAALTVSGAMTAWASEEIDENIRSALVTTSEGLTNSIIVLPDEDINNYLESGDDFTVNAMNSWLSAREELGDFVELQETEVEMSDGQYIATVPADFSGYDAEFVYVFEESGTPVSMSVDVQYPLSVTLERAALNTVMGLGTVFIMLLFLSFVISLFKFVPGLVEGKKNQPAPAPAPAPVPAAVPVEEVVPDDTELIAVIAAAIAASEGTATDGFVVRSIRKINHKKW